MADTPDHPTLVYNLRSLARFEHADLSIGDDAADALDRQAAEITALSKENDALRALAASRGCVYGHQSADGACSLGSPGCACMDDLVVTMAWSPEDKGAAATKRILQRAEKAEAEITALRSIIGDTVWCEGCGSVVPLDGPPFCDCIEVGNPESQRLHAHDCEVHEHVAKQRAEITALRAEIEALRAENAAAACTGG